MRGVLIFCNEVTADQTKRKNRYIVRKQQKRIMCKSKIFTGLQSLGTLLFNNVFGAKISHRNEGNKTTAKLTNAIPPSPLEMIALQKDIGASFSRRVRQYHHLHNYRYAHGVSPAAGFLTRGGVSPRNKFHPRNMRAHQPKQASKQDNNVPFQQFDSKLCSPG